MAPWPSTLRTVYGDHARFETTYFEPFKVALTTSAMGLSMGVEHPDLAWLLCTEVSAWQAAHLLCAEPLCL